MPHVYRAKEPFAFTSKRGLPRSIVPGDLMSGDDPDLKGREHLFERVEDAAARVRNIIEDTTAEPGELRSLSTVPGSKRGRGRPPKSESESHIESDAGSTESD